MAILAPHSDRAVQEYRHRSGARDTYWLNELVKYVRSQGLYDNFRLYPFMPRTNADSGSTAFGLGGLTTNDMTLVNGPTWGASGLAFASASSQYGSIADFLGSETLTVFARNTVSSTSPGTGTRGIVTQFSGISDRSFLFGYNYAASTGTRLFRSSDGGTANQEAYQNGTSELEDADICAVAQWVDGGGRGLWHNKTAQTLNLFSGSAQTSRFDESVNVLLAATDPASPTAFSNMTAHALAFLTGTVTTAQRETITDLINMIGKPPPLEALREYVAETGATDTLTLDRLTRYVSDEGLWDNFALYSMMPDTNYNSGSTVKVLGGLTTNDMTLVNGPTWGASGLAFASASSQYGSIADFLGSETLTCFLRTTETTPTADAYLLTQWETSGGQRSWAIRHEGNQPGDPYGLIRNSDGASSFEAYKVSNVNQTADTCFVAQWIDGGGRSLWFDKTAQSIALIGGTNQTSRYNSSSDILLNGVVPSSPTNFSDQTAHALAFITGTLTTTQRETITDLINEL